MRRTSNLDGFFDSIYYNSHASLKKLTDKNPSILNLRDSRGRTLLHRAVEECNSEKLSSLLRLGCDVNCLTRRDEKSALHLAVENGYVHGVKILLEHGADAEALVKDKGHDLTPLRLAIRRGHNQTEVVHKLLRHGARINRLVDGKSALYDAIERRDVEMVRCLLSCGADANLAWNGKTPLCLSITSESIPIAEHLLKSGAKINEYVMWTCMLTTPVCLTPLSIALVKPCLPMVEFLLDKGADPNPSPLGHSVYSERFSPICLAIMSGSVAALKCLLRANCDLRWEAPPGGNPHPVPYTNPIYYSLTRAGSSGTELIKLLLQAGYSLHIMQEETSSLLANECKRNPEFSAWLSSWQRAPQTLQLLCVFSLRRGLRAGIRTKLEQLGAPVPWKLRRLILLEELLAE